MSERFIETLQKHQILPKEGMIFFYFQIHRISWDGVHASESWAFLMFIKKGGYTHLLDFRIPRWLV
jgi:hypothetical protein